MSAIHKGKTISEEQRRQQSILMKARGIKSPSPKGRKHTLETRIKMSQRFQGKNSHFWRGGVAKSNKRIRESLRYRLWREAVFKRDGYMCVIGGKAHGKELNADHIKQFAYHPKLRFEIRNGRTLCVECHKKTDTFKRKI